ncbi:MAG: rod shape-determining protein MreD [Alistipes sp.]
MFRTFRYFVLFVTTLLLQVYLFDNLQISVYLNPLIYIAFIVLLPIETPPVVVLLSGVMTGVLMDWTMGAAGVNTIATVLVAFLRHPVLRMLCSRDTVRDGGIPSSYQLGTGVFLRYLLIMVLLHHAVFFLMESLSWVPILRTLLRVMVSSTVSILFIWLVARLFTSKLPGRI